MKTKESIKKKENRSISIFTVFLWLALIAVMTVITISGIKDKNAVESDEKLKLKIKIEDVEITPEMDEFYKNLKLDVHLDSNRDSKQIAKFNFLEVDSNGVYIYESDKTIENLKKNINNIRKYNVLYIDEFLIEGKYQYLLINGHEVKKENNYFRRNMYYDSDIEIVVRYINNIDINIDINIEGIENEEELNSICSNTNITISNDYNKIINNALIDGNDNYVTNIFLEDVELIDEVLRIKTAYNIDDYGRILELEIDNVKYDLMNSRLFDYNIPEEFLIGNEKKTLEIKFKFTYIPIDTYITQNVKWNEEENKKAVLSLGYTSTGKTFKGIDHGIITNTSVIYSVNLNDNFELSNEYENDNTWSIIETINTDEIKYGIPSDIWPEFFNKYEMYDKIEYTGKEFVYVKDTKTIYWLEKNVKMYGGNKEINLVYTGDDNEKESVELDVVDESNLCTVQYWSGEDIYYQKYNIKSPEIKFSHTEDLKAEVSMLFEGEKGKIKHYIGIFEDETKNKTDKIYMLEVINGNGSIIIDITDKEKTYYIYEVDENGNKVINKEIKYNKNKIEFASYERKISVNTDKSIISSVMSAKYDKEKEILPEPGYEYIYYFETDINESTGTGENNYINNVLSIKDTYQDKIVISSEVKKYTVKYVTTEGGNLEGDTEEIVNEWQFPQNVPTPKPNEGYEFIRWEVEVNGERIEVIPSEYEINEDTIFYAIFEKIPVEESVDTSDINVGAYVVVLVVAIVGIASVVFFALKNKKKSKENK